MKIAAFLSVWNEEHFIGPAIEQIIGRVDHVLVVLSEMPWYNWHRFGACEPKDRSRRNIEKFFPEVELIESTYCCDATQRNHGLARLRREYDYVWVIDADEFYTQEDMARILDQIAGDPVYMIHQVIYWKTHEWRWSPIDTWPPAILIDPKRSYFLHGRAVVQGLEECTMLDDVFVHHFSYVRTDAEMDQKLRHSPHTPELRSEWYEEAWRGWQPGSEVNVRPYPGSPIRAIYDPALAEIAERIERWQRKWEG